MCGGGGGFGRDGVPFLGGVFFFAFASCLRVFLWGGLGICLRGRGGWGGRGGVEGGVGGVWGGVIFFFFFFFFPGRGNFFFFFFFLPMTLDHELRRLPADFDL